MRLKFKGPRGDVLPSRGPRARRAMGRWPARGCEYGPGLHCGEQIFGDERVVHIVPVLLVQGTTSSVLSLRVVA